MFITLTGFDHYAGIESVRPGMKLKLKKEPDNQYDDETIAVHSLNDVKYGYVANSVYTVARGTHSAGYIYTTFIQETTCTVCFILRGAAIARLEDAE